MSNQEFIICDVCRAKSPGDDGLHHANHWFTCTSKRWQAKDAKIHICTDCVPMEQGAYFQPLQALANVIKMFVL